MFVGYGLSTSDGRWDDYRVVDVRGRIALALDGVPANVAATRLDKLIAARRAGAKALLIAGGELAELEATSSNVDLVSAGVTRDAADALLAPSGQTVGALQAAIATRRAPASFVVPDRRARIDVALEREDRRAVNVIGILPGTDPALAREAVLIGAHHDHVGVVNGQVHPGADDNASGTAIVLGLARAFATAGGAPRTLVFALFGAEEIGLVGSRHYVNAPAMPPGRTVAMINLDMVGRLGSAALQIGGVDSGSGLARLVNDAARAAGVAVKTRGAPFAPSDHLRFYRAGTPVLFFHTGRHDDYHKPTDTADRIDAAGLARVAAVAAGVVERLAAGGPVTYVKLQAPRAERRERRDRAGGAFLGVVGDATGGDGARLSEVMPGSAAERAGMRDGDVIVRIAGEPVQGFEDLRRVIGGKKPGDTVELVYLRNGEDRTASTALDARP
ncbi:MAG: M28 family peptidase [Candidatus Rokubacteria bacterium]|nr:M28 family peptidase [Candidatus Rokubacteria bacterium]